MLNKFLTRQRLYIILNAGSVGDNIAALPTLIKLFKNKQIIKIILNKKFFDLFSLFFPRSILFDIDDRHVEIDKDTGKKYDKLNFVAEENSLQTYLILPSNQITSLSISLIDIASINICGRTLCLEDKNYPLVDINKIKYDLPTKNKYVVINYGYHFKNRMMREDSFLAIKNYCLSKGYDIILLGNKNVSITSSGGEMKFSPVVPKSDFSGCIDLIDKTLLVEALYILYYAKCIIGVDNGILHLAGLTDTAILGGFTTVAPEFRLPVRHNILGWNCQTVIPNKECRFCQTDNYLALDVAFHICNKGTLDCVKNISNDDWISKLSLFIG